MTELLSIALRRRAQTSNDPEALIQAALEVEAFEKLLGQGRGAEAGGSSEPPPVTPEQIERLRGLDTADRVRFYEHDFYVFSNFSAFNLVWRHLTFHTSEAAYHYEKFCYIDESGVSSTAEQNAVAQQILKAPSAHEAFKIAERNKPLRRADWDRVKFDVMRRILRSKVSQHEYVRRKLLATGERELVEDSWRDDVWGWGPDRKGQNMLGRIWMEIRTELRKANVAQMQETPIDPPWGERERYRFVGGSKVYRSLNDFYDL